MPNVPPNPTASRLVTLCETYLRPPASYATDGVTGDPILVFEPALTAAEQAIYDDLVLLARSGLDIGLVKFRTIKADVKTIRDYVPLANPTAAQRLGWEKAMSRVTLVGLLRD